VPEREDALRRPDQLHGFEERLTTDVYPGDFGWTPDWRLGGERVDWWYHNMSSVVEAGVAEITNQLEYDDEVAFHAVRRLYDYARYERDAPLMLCVSFSHPHDPYVARQRYWDLYRDEDIDLPAAPGLAPERWTRIRTGSGRARPWTRSRSRTTTSARLGTATTRASRTSTSGSARCSQPSGRAGSLTTLW
jgi:arylsulfatase A-like enzyme